MFAWEWEDFEELMLIYRASISDAGPLKVPIRTFDVRRDENLALRLVVRGRFLHRSPPLERERTSSRPPRPGCCSPEAAATITRSRASAHSRGRSQAAQCQHGLGVGPLLQKEAAAASHSHGRRRTPLSRQRD